MIEKDVVIVGGGPAGSTAAWKLKEGGANCLILDRQEFPRLKLCAGWITPDVVKNLRLREDGYPYPIVEFTHFDLSFRGFPYHMKMQQFSIRRTELDEWLLQRSAVQKITHRVERIEKDGESYVIDGKYKSRYLIGAGGTACPVGRYLYPDGSHRPKKLQAVTLEEEFPYDGPMDMSKADIFFLDEGMPGYSWVVPKGNGYLNVGIGAMAQKLIRRKERIQDHWNQFIKKATDRGLVPQREWHPRGHNYYMASRKLSAQRENIYLVGDAVGLATRDMAEGIGPAVESAIMAANSILHREIYNPAKIRFYSSESTVAGKILEYFIAG